VADYALSVVAGEALGGSAAEARAAATEELSMFLGAGASRTRWWR